MNKIYLLGDCVSDNGPGIANYEIKKSLGDKYVVRCSAMGGYLTRIRDCVRGIINTDIVVVCSKSNINYLGIILSKIIKKPVFYVMHGFSSVENKINNPNISWFVLTGIKMYEKFVIKSVNKVILVSKNAAEMLANYYPKYSEKFEYIYNVVNINEFSNKKRKNEDKYKILSVGGDKILKRNNVVEEAVEMVNEEIEYLVVGPISIKKNINCKMRTKWLGEKKKNEVKELMEKTNLYIQNSDYETFGLSVIEALFSGNSILITKKVGCIDLFTNLTENDLISDNTNPQEIYKKIEYVMNNPNNERLLSGLKKECLSTKWQSKKIVSILNGVL